MGYDVDGEYVEFEKSYARIMAGIEKQEKAYDKEASNYLARPEFD